MAGAKAVEQNPETTEEKDPRNERGQTNVHGLPQIIRDPIITEVTHMVTVNGKKQEVTVIRQRN